MRGQPIRDERVISPRIVQPPKKTGVGSQQAVQIVITRFGGINSIDRQLTD
jgi:hypothetical protein